MHIILIAISLYLIPTGSDKRSISRLDMNQIQIEDFSSYFSMADFEAVKTYILSHGDRLTYRSYDGNNPHLRFGDQDVFLGADIGQMNIDNDPKRSDFNQMIIADFNTSDIRYYELIIVRPGDISKKKIHLIPGMEEGKVYLVDTYHKGIPNLKIKLPGFLKELLSIAQN